MNQLVSTQHTTSQHPRIAAALARIPSLLTSGEVMICAVVQLAFMAYFSLSRRQIVVATNQRLILLKRGLFGGFTMRDAQWQDLLDAQVKEKAFAESQGCEFLAHTSRGDFFVAGLPSAQAFGLYRICQEREQEWREKRRVREMEEARARAGGVTAHPVGATAGVGPGAAALMVQLQQLQQLRHGGSISDVEFEAMKAKLLAGM
ncbi:PH domain-containing protein [Nannocystis exedens]|uniref:PH domain-containing protein n=1 Tax=Nannocystis exedens TaxID=54 RepID=A0A1I2ADQ6_9BACT|nr:PH domain-containing protein [Nannocystis exedens]PCC69739.1 hypothetical protein NAEX_02764 [Nannocystis exedens]SFE41093.1 PH domain-containing protein [Nannocystis exedens]